jgi:hypothetical protein
MDIYFHAVHCPYFHTTHRLRTYQNQPSDSYTRVQSHWSLLVYFNHEEGRTLLLETFLSPTYLNTIQTSCPWVLRYLAAAAILSNKVAATSGAGATQFFSLVRSSIRELWLRSSRRIWFWGGPEGIDASRAAEEVVGNDFFWASSKLNFWAMRDIGGHLRTGRRYCLFILLINIEETVLKYHIRTLYF